MKTKHIVLSGLGVFLLWLFFWPSEKDHLNAQMAELCKKDGGVKIYEKVKLPADAYTSGGSIKESGYKKINETESIFLLANVFEVRRTVEKLKEGDPWKGKGSLVRIYSTILRLSDKKLIAESVHYSRSGGERWNAGHPSTDNCPLNDGIQRDKIFIKNQE